jgi:hypothetical protein
MKRHFYFINRLSARLALAFALIVTSGYAVAQEKPSFKVDFSINRSKPAETQEPGFEEWYVTQGAQDRKVIGGVTITLSTPPEAPYNLRNDWNKTYVQQAGYKERNGRLTFDGLKLDPTGYGTIIMKLEGLPAGEHILQTYHNCWSNPASTYAAPFTVKVNGTVVHENVQPSFLQAVAANACLLTTKFTVSSPGDAVEIAFSTSAEAPGTPGDGQTNYFNAPLINGMELNTTSITSFAKNPMPANGDMHVDGDSKTITLSWDAANENVKQHRLFIAKSEEELEAMSAPAAIYDPAQTTYALNDVYSLDTYFWRVDEVENDGNVTKGHTWSFKARQLAFPGAEGYGRYAQGGRGGIVYHVTSLENYKEGETPIPGTLRYGLKELKGPRTIVFDVSGIIDLGFEAIFTPANVTLAGQTAPGKGVCIKGANINIGSDNICRFMRFKHGYGDTGNAMGMSGSDHAIVDHTTTAWGTDETVSGRGAKNISFQYSTIFEALGIADHKNYPEGTNHGYAATIDGRIGSWHHNLLAHCQGRNWSMGGGMDGENRAVGQMDIFNNVVYNWGGRTTDGNCHEVNFVGNYYKMGEDTRKKVLFTQQYENIGHPSSTWQAYITGNIRENKDGSLTKDAEGETYDVQLSNGATMPEYPTVVDEPFFPSYAAIHSASDAFKIVTSEAGATMPMRDDQHLRIVDETINGTWTYVGSRSGIKGEIDHEDDCGGFEAYPEETRADDFDTDQDGMPDWYEKLVNSDPNIANNNDDPDNDGWTLLEDYLEFMANPYLVIKPGETETIDVVQFFKGFTNSPEYTIEGDNDLFSASISGSTVTVKANENGGIGVITMKVRDSEGSVHRKRLSVAVTGDVVSGISNAPADNQLKVAKRELFTVDGKIATSFKRGEVYIMKTTDTENNVHTTKVIKN